MDTKQFWTKELCEKEAIKYSTRGSFCIGSPSSYNKSRKNGWLDEICSHMIKIKNPKGYWTKELCKKEAMKYKSRSDFSKLSTSAYSKSWDNKWLDEICNHMNQIGNRYKRCIYSCEFIDGSVYVGLTFNFNNRKNQHLRFGPVYIHLKLIKSVVFNQLTEYMDVDVAKIKENEYCEYYKRNGWSLLNTAKSGALGSSERKWTKEKCRKEASKFINIKDYMKNSLSYKAATRNKWLDEICQHMNRTKKGYCYWTKQKCEEASILCKSKKEFSKKYPGGYRASRKNKWSDEICQHMISRSSKPKGYWTKDRCQEESLKFNRRSDFQRENSSAYTTSTRNKWLDEICQHMN